MAKEGFLFGNELITELENLIKESKNRLLLVSPYIDLAPRIQEVLRTKLEKSDFELHVLFGKNENNIYKSVKQDSFEFLKQFPNCEIRYNSRLHAKFYLNDYNWIVSSINLYDYSLSNNIEVGMQITHSSKGIVSKALDKGAQKIGDGFDNLKQNLFGGTKEIDPIVEFDRIFQDSDLMYATEPIMESKGGIKGAFGGQKLSGINVIVDNLLLNRKNEKITPIGFNAEKREQKNSTSTKEQQNTPHISDEKLSVPKIAAKTGQVLSASKIAAKYGNGITAKKVNILMESNGFIKSDQITEAGKALGLVEKSYMGKPYIAYPDDLDVFNKL